MCLFLLSRKVFFFSANIEFEIKDKNLCQCPNLYNCFINDNNFQIFVYKFNMCLKYFLKK